MPDRSPTLSVEQQLLERIPALESVRDGYIALHFHLSRLQGGPRTERLTGAAASALENSLGGGGGEVFALNNRDIFVFAPRALQSAAKDAVSRLHELFSDDPMIASDDAHDTALCTWRDLKRDYEDLARVVYETLGQRRAKGPQRESPRRDALRPDHIIDVERSLEAGNIAAFTSSQAVCAMAGNGLPQRVYDEYFVAIDNLQEHLLPGVDMRSNRWLFLRLTETLDAKILETLEADERFGESAFSVNLNLSTILAPRFQAFDEKVNDRLRGRMLVELQATDVFADAGGFLYARERLGECGYGICLDGLTPMTLPLLATEGAGFEMMKLFWDPRQMDPRDDTAMQRLAAEIAQIGPSRLILSRCDNQYAIKIGRRLGLSLFQGFAVDKLLHSAAPESDPMVAPTAAAAE